MPHEQIYLLFARKFPSLANEAKDWMQNGKNSVRIRLYNELEIIFTYNNDNDWCMETTKSFIKHMKGVK